MGPELAGQPCCHLGTHQALPRQWRQRRTGQWEPCAREINDFLLKGSQLCFRGFLSEVPRSLYPLCLRDAGREKGPQPAGAGNLGANPPQSRVDEHWKRLHKLKGAVQMLFTHGPTCQLHVPECLFVCRQYLGTRDLRQRQKTQSLLCPVGKETGASAPNCIECDNRCVRGGGLINTVGRGSRQAASQGPELQQILKNGGVSACAIAQGPDTDPPHICHWARD